MTTISLCVIAQDKAPTLPDCIRSTNGIVDEVIILDTGKLNNGRVGREQRRQDDPLPMGRDC